MSACHKCYSTRNTVDEITADFLLSYLFHIKNVLSLCSQESQVTRHGIQIYHTVTLCTSSRKSCPSPSSLQEQKSHFHRVPPPTWRLRNFVFSTKILVGNRCGNAEFCLFMNYLTEVFINVEHLSPLCWYHHIIPGTRVPRSTKASEKYLEQGRFMIIFI